MIFLIHFSIVFSDDDDGFNPMVAKIADDDSDVEVDTYEPSIPKVQDFSEDRCVKMTQDVSQLGVGNRRFSPPE